MLRWLLPLRRGATLLLPNRRLLHRRGALRLLLLLLHRRRRFCLKRIRRRRRILRLRLLPPLLRRPCVELRLRLVLRLRLCIARTTRSGAGAGGRGSGVLVPRPYSPIVLQLLAWERVEDAPLAAQALGCEARDTQVPMYKLVSAFRVPKRAGRMHMRRRERGEDLPIRGQVVPVLVERHERPLVRLGEEALLLDHWEERGALVVPGWRRQCRRRR